ncbi:MAG: 4-hydroxy-3-methylbut-2-en-yl diphosphate synthase, partial [Bacteroidota bacterium]
FHNILLSMKSSNPQVMVQAYRLLVRTMQEEFGECYPLHLGVTEAGDGEDGRIKSAIGIGTLLEDGIGDTIRVSLTEDPEFEIPVCRDIVQRYQSRSASGHQPGIPAIDRPTYSPFEYNRRDSFPTDVIGGKQVPVVVADLSRIATIKPEHLRSIGYTYDRVTDKWSIGDAAADFLFTGNQLLEFDLPGTLKVIVYPATWQLASDQQKYLPLFSDKGYAEASVRSPHLNFVMVEAYSDATPVNDHSHLDTLANDPAVVLCLRSAHSDPVHAVRRLFMEFQHRGIRNPALLMADSSWQTPDEHLIHFATETGALLLDGFGDGIWLGYTGAAGMEYTKTAGRTYLEVKDLNQFTNNTAFSILQATRTRISKTEYISCPSCGRTLFDLQETTARIRAVTHHLKGVKIAIMGCIVNGPGEMADADFGYVGSGPGKITLYKGKDIMKRNVNSEVAVEELIGLLKEHGAWIEPTPLT